MNREIRSLWLRVLAKSVAVSLLLYCLWAMKDKGAYIVYMKF